MLPQQMNYNSDNRIYLCIDLKSFYASVECVERGLDPLYHQSCGGRPGPHGPDNLSCSFTLYESAWSQEPVQGLSNTI